MLGLLTVITGAQKTEVDVPWDGEKIQADTIKEFKRKKKEREIQEQLRKHTASVVLYCKVLLTLAPNLIGLIVKVFHDITDPNKYLLLLFFSYTVNAATKLFYFYVLPSKYVFKLNYSRINLAHFV